jgi:menaquinone-dependent protoporphyrinogen IX oxidase
MFKTFDAIHLSSKKIVQFLGKMMLLLRTSPEALFSLHVNQSKAYKDYHC